MSAKLIGEVAAAPGGYVVRVYRYATGRKLPHLRVLVDESDPKHLKAFASRLTALEALRQFETDPRSCRVLRREDILTVRSECSDARPVRHIKPVAALDHEGEHKTPKRKPAKTAKRVNTPVIKLMEGRPAQVIRKDKDQLAIEAWIASGAVKVTRLAEQPRDTFRRW